MIRPRVVLVTTYYHPVLGGAETHARQLARALAARGFPMAILTKRTDRALPSEDRVDGVAVSRLPPAGERSGAGKWLFLPFALAALVRRRRGYDLICCVDYRGIGIAAIAAGRLFRRPVVAQAATTGVLSCGNWDDALARRHVAPDGRLGRAIKWPARRIYGAADDFICISRDIEREALDAGVPRERVHYLPHGVDLARFAPAPPAERDRIRGEEGWPPDRTVCLFVGRLSTEKGILDLLDAWRRIRDPKALLVAVGPDMPGHDWDAGPAARRLVEQHGLRDRVLFHGPSTETARLFRAADVFVQPSHFEAFGISVIEAMASGLPVVASNVGGMKDFLVDDANALLCPARQPVALAGAIARLLADPGLRSRLGAAGRATVERDFDEAHLFDRYADILQAAAGRRAGRRETGR